MCDRHQRDDEVLITTEQCLCLRHLLLCKAAAMLWAGCGDVRGQMQAADFLHRSSTRPRCEELGAAGEAGL